MKPKHYLRPILRLSAAVVCMSRAAGCSPDVYVHAGKSGYPARTADAPVVVYDFQDSVPARSELLGYVEIKDNGSSGRKGYEEILQIARKRTNKLGGNGLHLVWHEAPSKPRTTIHQISADMLRLPDSVYANAIGRNMQEQQERIARYDGPAVTVRQNGRTVRRRKSGNHIHLTAGYAFMLNDYIPERLTETDFTRGLSINAGYQWISGLGIGFGARYSGYFVFGKQRYQSMFEEHSKYTLALHYVAPEFAARQSVGDRWSFREAVGIGYACYTETKRKLTSKQSGFGVHGAAGVDYRIRPWIGVGIHIMIQHAMFSGDPVEDILHDRTEKENPSLTTLSLNGGLNFYF